MAKSAKNAGVSVSVELLLAVLLSVVPAGAMTMAVLTRLPVADAWAVPLTMKMTELPAPAAMLAVALKLLPAPLAPLVTLALPVVLEVHVTPVRPDGIVSVTEAPTASFGPLLVTVIVYVTCVPGVYVAEPSVLLMARSAKIAPRSVSVELLLFKLLSVVAEGGETVAVLTRLPVSVAWVVPLTVKITELPAPAAMLTTALKLLPDPLAPLVTLALPVVLEVHVTPVRPDGIRSETVAPTALPGPLLVTVIVYVTCVPGV